MSKRKIENPYDKLLQSIEAAIKLAEDAMLSAEETRERPQGVDVQSPAAPALYEHSFITAIESLGEPDDVFNKWHFDEGELRSFVYTVMGQS